MPAIALDVILECCVQQDAVDQAFEDSKRAFDLVAAYGDGV